MPEHNVYGQVLKLHEDIRRYRLNCYERRQLDQETKELQNNVELLFSMAPPNHSYRFPKNLGSSEEQSAPDSLDQSVYNLFDQNSEGKPCDQILYPPTQVCFEGVCFKKKRIVPSQEKRLDRPQKRVSPLPTFQSKPTPPISKQMKPTPPISKETKPAKYKVQVRSQQQKSFMRQRICSDLNKLRRVTPEQTSKILIQKSYRSKHQSAQKRSNSKLSVKNDSKKKLQKRLRIEDYSKKHLEKTVQLSQLKDLLKTRYKTQKSPQVLKSISSRRIKGRILTKSKLIQ